MIFQWTYSIINEAVLEMWKHGFACSSPTLSEQNNLELTFHNRNVDNLSTHDKNIRTISAFFFFRKSNSMLRFRDVTFTRWKPGTRDLSRINNVHNVFMIFGAIFISHNSTLFLIFHSNRSWSRYRGRIFCSSHSGFIFGFCICYSSMLLTQEHITNFVHVSMFTFHFRKGHEAHVSRSYERETSKW